MQDSYSKLRQELAHQWLANPTQQEWDGALKHFQKEINSERVVRHLKDVLSLILVLESRLLVVPTNLTALENLAKSWGREEARARIQKYVLSYREIAVRNLENMQNACNQTSAVLANKHPLPEEVKSLLQRHFKQGYKCRELARTLIESKLFTVAKCEDITLDEIIRKLETRKDAKCLLVSGLRSIHRHQLVEDLSKIQW